MGMPWVWLNQSSAWIIVPALELSIAAALASGTAAIAGGCDACRMSGGCDTCCAKL